MNEGLLKRGRRCCRFRGVRLVKGFIVTGDLRNPMLDKMEIAIREVDDTDLVLVT